jgi:hypothetical protein
MSLPGPPNPGLGPLAAAPRWHHPTSITPPRPRRTGEPHRAHRQDPVPPDRTLHDAPWPAPHQREWCACKAPQGGGRKQSQSDSSAPRPQPQHWWRPSVTI